MMQATPERTAYMLHDPNGALPSLSVLLRCVRYGGNVWLYVVPAQDCCNRCGERVAVRLNNAGTHVACSCTGWQWRTVTGRELHAALDALRCNRCGERVQLEHVAGDGVRVVCSCTVLHHTAPDIPLDDTDETTDETTDTTAIVTPLNTNSNATTQQQTVDCARQDRSSVVLRTTVGNLERAKALRAKQRGNGNAGSQSNAGRVAADSTQQAATDATGGGQLPARTRP